MRPRISLNDKTPLELAFELSLRGERPESLSEFTSVARLNPSALIERSLNNNLDRGFLAALMQTLVSRYIAHYMQSVALSLNIGDVSAEQILAPFSDNPISNPRIGIGFESNDRWTDDAYALPDFGFESASKIEIDANISKPGDLAVGKLIHVPIRITDKSTITMPVNVTLSPREADLDFIIELMGHLSKDRSLSARWHGVMAGELRFFKDFIFAQDLLESERKLAIKEGDDGFFKASEKRRAAGLLSTALVGGKHLNVASNMLVLSKTGAAKLENEVGKLNNSRKRAALFRETGSMMICVVDPERERVRIYTRGLEESGTYTYDDLKQNGTNANGVDINALMKAYNMAEKF